VWDLPAAGSHHKEDDPGAAQREWRHSEELQSRATAAADNTVSSAGGAEVGDGLRSNHRSR
jgi:hypothetical protein